MNRRTFLGALSVPAILSLTGSASAQSLSEPAGYRAIPTWFGPAAARPDPSDLADRSGEVLYLSTAGKLSHLVLGESEWTELPKTLAAFEPDNLPTDLPNGALVFDKYRNLPAWWDTDHYEYPNFVDDVLTSPVTVSNTSTRTVVWQPDINANSLVKGRIYQIDLHGRFTTANTSDSFTVDVNIGGTDAAELSNAQQNAADDPWTLEITFTVRQHGQNGIIKPNTRATFDEQPRTARHGEIAIDTTTATNLAVAVDWSAADPDNSVTLEQAHLKQMG